MIAEKRKPGVQAGLKGYRNDHFKFYTYACRTGNISYTQARPGYHDDG